MTDSIISTTDIQKTFAVGTQEVQVLKGISVSIARGDFTVIFGPSGCGKSTLLHIILGLEPPTSGQVVILGQDLFALGQEDDRSDFRKRHIGMVYQQPNWIKSLTVGENVSFPLVLLGVAKEEALSKAGLALGRVEMQDWMDYRPTDLSSGQQQRVALARALVTDPEIIIADEPTGNLDYEGGQALMKLLRDMSENNAKTVVMVTHDLDYIKFAKSAIHILDGKLMGTYSGQDKEKLFKQFRGKRNVTITE
jgi:putative ABC transport system ATP-binding protein